MTQDSTPKRGYRSLKGSSGRRIQRIGDVVLRYLSAAAACFIVVMLVVLIGCLVNSSLPSIKAYGFNFIVGSDWRPNELEVPKLDPAGHVIIEDGETQTTTLPASFGALPVIYGTLVSSIIALIIAVPISLGASLFLIRIAKPRVVAPVSFLIEFLAAIPSIAYGIWGLFVLAPLLQGNVRMPGFLAWPLLHVPGISWITTHLMNWAFTASGTPDAPELYFRGVEPILAEIFLVIPGMHFMVVETRVVGDEMVTRQLSLTGRDMFCGGLVLGIMILPIITAISRDVLRAVPRTQIEGTVALGATWWQTSIAMLRYARSGLFGAVVLGLARAAGETMAITMVIGNNNQIRASLFSPAQTMSSLLANEFAEAVTDVHRAALSEVALILLVSSLLFNVVARYLVVGTGARSAAAH